MILLFNVKSSTLLETGEFGGIRDIEVDIYP